MTAQTICAVMNTFTSKIVGLGSSLLASAGLLRAAESFDPLTRALGNRAMNSAAENVPGADCTLPCQYSPLAVRHG